MLRHGTRSRRCAAATTALGVVLLVAGCSSPAPGTPPPVPADRVGLPDHAGCDQLYPGKLCSETGHGVEGRLHERGGCIWLELSSGREAAVVWPFGYSASFDPFAVFDESGRRLADDNDLVVAAGWGPTSGSPDACGRTDYMSLSPAITVYGR